MSNTDESEADRDDQYRLPRGELGRSVGVEMARDHLPENLWTLAQLDLRPGDRVLEIGFGPGVAVGLVLEALESGAVAGIDHSRLMVEEASARNREAIAAGRADLRHGDAAALPFDDGSFDKVFSVHGLYFWKEPRAVLAEARRVLRPGGRLVITMLPKERWTPNPPGSPLAYGTPECTPYWIAEVETLMRDAGFARTEVRAGEDPGHMSNLSVIGIR